VPILHSGKDVIKKKHTFLIKCEKYAKTKEKIYPGKEKRMA
jgi:hypothetical protein